MPEYYKYAGRDAADQVNWAEIGKNMSDMLANENKIREDKKAAIDEASRQFGLQLANAPQGQDASARSAALEYADNASKFMRMQDQLLKSGKMKFKDYTVARQNLLDGTDQAFDSLTGYQKVFGEKMERARTDKSAAYELHAMQKAEGFGNWSQSGFYINPTNGQVNIALKDKQNIDGKDIYTMSKNPNKVASTAYVKGLIQGQWDKFNTMESTQAWSKSLGSEVHAAALLAGYGRTGKITTVEDITSRTDIVDADKKILYKFVDAENQYIDGALANPFARASVLTDSLKNCPRNGKQYRFTNDPIDAKNNPEAILEIINPSTQQGELKFSDEQHEDSGRFMLNQARSQYDYKQEVKVTDELTPITATGKAIKDEEDLALNFAKQTSKLTSGTDEEKKQSVAYFRGKGANIESRADGVYLENENGEMVPFIPKGSTSSFGSSIVGPLLKATKTDLSDTKVVKYFPKFMGKQFNVTGVGKGMEEARDVAGEFNTKIVDEVKPNLFTNKKVKDTVVSLNKLLKNVQGISIKEKHPNWPGNNTISIEYTDADGKIIQKEVNSNGDESSAAEDTKTIQDLLRSVDESRKLNAIGTTPVTAPPVTAPPAGTPPKVDYSKKGKKP